MPMFGHQDESAIKYRERFWKVLLRAEQEWDQHHVDLDERRGASRREQFHQRLSTLLEGEAYQKSEAVTEERLLNEVTAMVFPPVGGAVEVNLSAVELLCF